MDLPTHCSGLMAVSNRVLSAGCDLLRAVEDLPHREHHVALAAAQPDVTEENSSQNQNLSVSYGINTQGKQNIFANLTIFT